MKHFYHSSGRKRASFSLCIEEMVCTYSKKLYMFSIVVVFVYFTFSIINPSFLLLCPKPQQSRQSSFQDSESYDRCAPTASLLRCYSSKQCVHRRQSVWSQMRMHQFKGDRGASGVHPPPLFLFPCSLRCLMPWRPQAVRPRPRPSPLVPPIVKREFCMYKILNKVYLQKKFHGLA